ncbi:MAG: hypothetical protein ABIZ80_11045, partial [Bryobacteraceae bacterium]
EQVVDARGNRGSREVICRPLRQRHWCAASPATTRDGLGPGFDQVLLFIEDGCMDQLAESLRLWNPWVDGERTWRAMPLEIEQALASETLPVPARWNS